MAKRGRPIGSKTKPQFGDFITSDEVKKLVEKAKALANKGDPKLLVFCLEHIFGKARQPIDGGLDEQGKPIPLLGGQSYGLSSNNSSKETSQLKEED